MITGDLITKEEEVEFTIELMVKDIKKSIDFYTNIIGFKLHRIGTDGKFAIISFGKSILMLAEVDGLPEPRFSGLEVRILVDDIESVYKEVQKRGAEIDKPLIKAPYGLNTFHIKNPDGVNLKFASLIV